ncbi:hypothetical protein PMAC_001681 [Pneumocystis sp. 'macacae']|nr:hypothetical protein PMAC_001681 [Pneumocystis sp. 'macacae']
MQSLGYHVRLTRERSPVRARVRAARPLPYCVSEHGLHSRLRGDAALIGWQCAVPASIGLHAGLGRARAGAPVEGRVRAGRGWGLCLGIGVGGAPAVMPLGAPEGRGVEDGLLGTELAALEDEDADEDEGEDDLGGGQHLEGIGVGEGCVAVEEESLEAWGDEYDVDEDAGDIKDEASAVEEEVALVAAIELDGVCKEAEADCSMEDESVYGWSSVEQLVVCFGIEERLVSDGIDPKGKMVNNPLVGKKGAAADNEVASERFFHFLGVLMETEAVEGIWCGEDEREDECCFLRRR